MDTDYDGCTLTRARHHVCLCSGIWETMLTTWTSCRASPVTSSSRSQSLTAAQCERVRSTALLASSLHFTVIYVCLLSLASSLQNMTSSVPYMGCPGNHEQAFNFSHYKNKFSLYNYITDPSGTTDDHTWWYSWDYMSGGAKVHVLALDSELYYWDYLHSTEVGGNFPAMIQAQWQWIVDDLTAAYDSGEYAWIFAYSHRPMYCSNTDDVPDCTTDAETLRRGILNANGTYQWGFEDALSVRPIDLYLSAHEHSYERTLPVRNGVIDQQADLNRYVDPKYPTHIIAGAGGCREYFNYFDEVFYGPWSVVRSATYGYGHLTVHNATHLHWDQLLDEGRGGRDELWIVKTQDDDSDEDAKDSRSRPSVPADDDAGVVWPERLALE